MVGGVGWRLGASVLNNSDTCDICCCKNCVVETKLDVLLPFPSIVTLGGVCERKKCLLKMLK